MKHIRSTSTERHGRNKIENKYIFGLSKWHFVGENYFRHNIEGRSVGNSKKRKTNQTNKHVATHFSDD